MASTISCRNLPMLLLKAREAVICHFRPLLNHYGLTEQQWRVIRTLCEEEELEPRQICESCQILSPSLVGMLVRLEEMGLVERTRHPEDQRRILVRPTRRSKALVAEMAPLVEAQYHLLEKTLGKDLVAALYQVADRLIAADGSAVEKVALPKRARRAASAVESKSKTKR